METGTCKCKASQWLGASAKHPRAICLWYLAKEKFWKTSKHVHAALESKWKHPECQSSDSSESDPSSLKHTRTHWDILQPVQIMNKMQGPNSNSNDNNVKKSLLHCEKVIQCSAFPLSCPYQQLSYNRSCVFAVLMQPTSLASAVCLHLHLIYLPISYISHNALRLAVRFRRSSSNLYICLSSAEILHMVVWHFPLML